MEQEQDSLRIAGSADVSSAPEPQAQGSCSQPLLFAPALSADGTSAFPAYDANEN